MKWFRVVQMRLADLIDWVDSVDSVAVVVLVSFLYSRERMYKQSSLQRLRFVSVLDVHPDRVKERAQAFEAK